MTLSKQTFARQRDKNEPAIVRALERVGASVQRLNELGVPDLLVGFRDRTYLLEVKRSLRDRTRGDHNDLNENQVKWWDKFRGARPHLVRSPEDALAAIGIVVVTPGMYRVCPGGDVECVGDACQFAVAHQYYTYPRE